MSSSQFDKLYLIPNDRVLVKELEKTQGPQPGMISALKRGILSTRPLLRFLDGWLFVRRPVVATFHNSSLMNGRQIRIAQTLSKLTISSRTQEASRCMRVISAIHLVIRRQTCVDTPRPVMQTYASFTMYTKRGDINPR